MFAYFSCNLLEARLKSDYVGESKIDGVDSLNAVNIISVSSVMCRGHVEL